MSRWGGGRAGRPRRPRPGRADPRARGGVRARRAGGRDRRLRQPRARRAAARPQGHDIRLGDPIAVRRDSRRAPGVFARTFADVARGGLLLYEDAGGSLAVAVNGGDAAALLGAGRGDELRVERGMTLGRPRLHLRSTGSTNERARDLALAGAPHGTVVTAGEQTAGRGRQGRGWSTPPGHARSRCRWCIRDPTRCCSLRAGLAVADLAGPAAQVKWPNDVLLDGRKVAGVLVEGRPQEGWAVLGIGVNAALDLARAAGGAARHGRDARARPARARRARWHDLLAALETRLGEAPDAMLAALRGRDALPGGRSAGRAAAGPARGSATTARCASATRPGRSTSSPPARSTSGRARRSRGRGRAPRRAPRARRR